MTTSETVEHQDLDCELIVHPSPGRQKFGAGNQSYGRREGDRLEQFEFDFSRELISDILHIYSGYADAEQLRSVGNRVREFLVAAKVNPKALNALTICSDAEEIYGLPLELASRGPVSLGTSDVALRYRWPDTKAIVEGDKRGRVLFAWASPKKPVPNREHCTAIQKTTNSWFRLTRREML